MPVASAAPMTIAMLRLSLLPSSTITGWWTSASTNTPTTVTSCAAPAADGGDGAPPVPVAPASVTATLSTIDERARRRIDSIRTSRQRTARAWEQYRLRLRSSQMRYCERPTSRSRRGGARGADAQAQAREEPEREDQRERHPHRPVPEAVRDVPESHRADRVADQVHGAEGAHRAPAAALRRDVDEQRGQRGVEEAVRAA